MNKVFTKNGWDDYIYWQTEDKKTFSGLVHQLGGNRYHEAAKR